MYVYMYVLCLYVCMYLSSMYTCFFFIIKDYDVWFMVRDGFVGLHLLISLYGYLSFMTCFYQF